MTLPLVALSVAAPLIAVEGEGVSIFPAAEDFRTQVIERQKGDSTWPFTVSRGILLCTEILGQPVVYFADAFEKDASPPRVALVSVNPFDLGFGNAADGGLVRRELTMEDRIEAMAPLVVIGQRLCSQPKGTNIGPGEL